VYLIFQLSEINFNRVDQGITVKLQAQDDVLSFNSGNKIYLLALSSSF
jgi:hypothetical protein